jgi:hypothetical protein
MGEQQRIFKREGKKTSQRHAIKKHNPAKRLACQSELSKNAKQQSRQKKQDQMQPLSRMSTINPPLKSQNPAQTRLAPEKPKQKLREKQEKRASQKPRW